MQKTPNYNLPQFQSTDQIYKEDLNNAYLNIDTAIGDLQEAINSVGTPGNDLQITTEVITARKGEASLKDKIDKIDQSFDDNKKIQKITRNTDGYFDNGAVFTVIGNEGHGDIGVNPKAQVCGFTSVQKASEYGDRDSVGMYLSNRSRPATLTVTTGTITYTATTVQVTGTTIDMSGIKAGMLIDTKHTPNRWTSVIASIDTVNQIITVQDGWYVVQTGGSQTPSAPTNGTGFDVNMVTKIWGINNNVFLDADDTTSAGVAEEIGLFNTKSNDALSGIDLVNFGTNTAGFGFQVRKTSTGGKVTAGFQANNTTYGLKVLSDTTTDYILYSTGTDNVYDSASFFITNTGAMNKLSLQSQNITNSSTSMSSSCSIFYMNFSGTYTLPTPSARGTNIIFIRNNGGSVITLTTPSGNIYSKQGVSVNYVLRPSCVVTLTSDGTNYLSFSEVISNITGSAAPSTTPDYVGQEFLDTTNKKLYKAFGTASSADWVVMN